MMKTTIALRMKILPLTPVSPDKNAGSVDRLPAPAAIVHYVPPDEKLPRDDQPSAAPVRYSRPREGPCLLA
jgi:hypothetical protein